MRVGCPSVSGGFLVVFSCGGCWVHLLVLIEFRVVFSFGDFWAPGFN